MLPPLLHSDILRLVPTDLTHSKFMVRLLSHAEIAPRTNYPERYTERMAVEEILSSNDPIKHRGKWVIEVTGVKVGLINISQYGDTGRYQGGYWILPEHQGKGLGAEALRLLKTYLVETRGAIRLQALVEPNNLASMRILEKNGYVREGLLRRFFPHNIHGLVDVYMYGWVRED